MIDIPSDTNHQVAAFARRFGKMVKPDSPGFAMVIMGDDGEPFTIARANRTDLTFAATTLLFEVLEQEKAGACICPTCDGWTAKARAALIAMGHTLPGAN